MLSNHLVALSSTARRSYFVNRQPSASIARLWYQASITGHPLSIINHCLLIVTLFRCKQPSHQSWAGVLTIKKFQCWPLESIHCWHLLSSMTVHRCHRIFNTRIQYCTNNKPLTELTVGYFWDTFSWDTFSGTTGTLFWDNWDAGTNGHKVYRKT